MPKKKKILRNLAIFQVSWRVSRTMKKKKKYIQQFFAPSEDIHSKVSKLVWMSVRVYLQEHEKAETLIKVW